MNKVNINFYIRYAFCIFRKAWAGMCEIENKDFWSNMLIILHERIINLLNAYKNKLYGMIFHIVSKKNFRFNIYF